MGVAIVIIVLIFAVLIVVGTAAKSISKSAQKMQGRSRCVKCKSRLKAYQGKYATTCRKCGAAQPWAA